MKIFSLTLLCFLAVSLLPLRGEILKDARGNFVRYGGDYAKGTVKLPDVLRRRSPQFRGVWCATVQNLDFPRCANAAEFKKHFLAVIGLLKKHNCNVLIFQVRANADAVYLSKYNPFSAWISGKEGVTLGNFDPLPWMVKVCHRNGIEFHAWLNPYRITGSTPLSKAKYLATLPPRHIARLRPDLVIAHRNPDGSWALQFDPGRGEVVNHLAHTVQEILLKAPVDAIHFDDYFYPYNHLPFEADAATVARFNPGKLSQPDWRRNNVNFLIQQISGLCRKHKVAFGISPFGIWGNAKDIKGGSLTGGTQSRSAIYADSLFWMQKGYLDYIIPQLYWSFDHPKAAYAALTDWWVLCARSCPPTKLYIGHGLYRISPAELYNQLRYNSVHREIRGEALYALRHLRNANFSKLLKKCWSEAVPARETGKVRE